MINRRLPLFVGIGVVVLAILLTLVLIMPKMSAVGSAQAELQAAQGKETQLQAQLEDLEALRGDAAEINRQLSKAQTLIPPQADKPGIIRLVQLAADKAGVDLVSLSPSSPAESDTGDFSSIPITIAVTGTFFQVDQFLFELETLPRAFKVTTMDIAPTEWPQLTLSVSAEAYTTDLSAGPGSTPGHQDTAEGSATAPTAPLSPGAAPGESPTPTP